MMGSLMKPRKTEITEKLRAEINKASSQPCCEAIRLQSYCLFVCLNLLKFAPPKIQSSY